MELRETHQTMTITDIVARKHFRLVFHNTNTSPRTEATFFMDLEPDQRVDRFKVTIAGKEAEAEILDQEKARKIYEDIVRKQKDPALLEYSGYRLLRCRIFPLPPQSTFEVEVETIETLRSDGGLVRVQTMNASPASFKKPIERASIQATIATSRPLRTVFSPTHAADVARRNSHEARLSWEKRDYVPAGPFVFYFATDDRGIGATLLAYAEPGEDGAFMLTLAPPGGAPDAERLPRDIVFLVDTSGSMNEAGKIDQARRALARFVETLAERDRFAIVTFGTEAAKYRDDLVAATADARDHARRFVENLRARGGTAVEEALALAGQGTFRPEATRIVVLLSDGVPTIGERDPQRLTALAVRLQARIFSFGIGADVHTQLLDRLAIETGGDRVYVQPNEDLAAVLEGFAKRIDAPILARPALTFDGQVTEIHPRRLPDIFRGGELTVYGRFRGDGPRRVELSGLAGGKRVTRTYEIDLRADRRHDFVPRLWAIQKIDFLIDEIRRHGTSKELVDHIVELAKRYAIVTPYTSFLMTEDAATARARVESNLRNSKADGFTGPRELALVGNQQQWRAAGNQEAQVYACNGALGRGSDARGVAQTLAEQRVVCNRAFYNGAKGWVDASFASQQARVLKFGSEDYFQFARENPDAGRMLALGNNVTFQHRNQWFRVEL